MILSYFEYYVQECHSTTLMASQLLENASTLLTLLLFRPSKVRSQTKIDCISIFSVVIILLGRNLKIEKLKREAPKMNISKEVLFEMSTN